MIEDSAALEALEILIVTLAISHYCFGENQDNLKLA